ncbi:hypothetical protein JCM6882_005358 [Rhodosporidiobolus microsporus]
MAEQHDPDYTNVTPRRTRRPRAPRAAKTPAPAQKSEASPPSPSSSRKVGRSVCDTCKRCKVACDLAQPCKTCSGRGVDCNYTWFNAEGQLIRRSAAELAAEIEQEKLAPIREELATLLRKVDDLSTKLRLSQDELVDLYEQVCDLVQHSPPLAEDASTRRDTPTPQPEEDEGEMAPPPAPKRKTRTAASLSSPIPPSRFPRAAKNIATSATAPYPPPTARPSYLRPPPLPPIDMSGKVRSGRTYHFPITESTKAPMELDSDGGEDGEGAGGGEEQDSCGEDEEGAFFSLVHLCGGRLSAASGGPWHGTAGLTAILTS